MNLYRKLLAWLERRACEREARAAQLLDFCPPGDPQLRTLREEYERLEAHWPTVPERILVGLFFILNAMMFFALCVGLLALLRLW